MLNKAGLHRKAADIIEAIANAERTYWLDIEDNRFVIKLDHDGEAVVLWEQEGDQ